MIPHTQAGQMQKTELPIHSATGYSQYGLFTISAAILLLFARSVGRQALVDDNSLQLAFSGAVYLAGITIFLLPWISWRVSIYQDHIELKRFFGLWKKSVRREDLSFFVFLKSNVREITWVRLHIYCGDEKIEFNSLVFENFWPIFHEITAGLPEKPHFQSSLFKNKIVPVVIYFLALFSLGGMFFQRGYMFNMSQKDLRSMTCTLAKAPKIMQPSGKNSDDFLLLATEEYPGFNFNLKGAALEACHSNSFIKNTYPGSKIHMQVCAKDFEKLTRMDHYRNSSGSFFGNNRVEVYSLVTDHYEYLLLNNYQKIYRAKNQQNFWLFVFFMGCFAVVWEWQGRKNSRIASR